MSSSAHTALVAAAVLAGVCVASAEPRDERLELARVCHFEARFSRTDCAAIFWIVLKRAEAQDRQWIDVLTDYSRLYEAKGARARLIRAFQWGDVDGAGERFNAAWADQRVFATDILLGVVPDPCPDAIHWGGRTDPQPPGFVEVQCTDPTANRMYRLVRRTRAVRAPRAPWALAVLP